jgi:tetratricopeptide (TPR) repeat protein
MDYWCPPMPPRREDYLNRILNSPNFAQSPRLGRLLQYLFTHSDEGSEDALKESVVGVNVFDRPPGYDLRKDSIVRSSMRLLRFKLEEYYRGPGSEDSLRLEIPKGSYVMHFIDSLPATPHAPTPPIKRRFYFPIGLAILFFLLSAFVAYRSWTRPSNQKAVSLASLDPASQEKFLRAERLKRIRSAASLREAEQLLESVLKQHPNFAPAHASLAESLGILGGNGHVPFHTVAARAEAAAARAVSLDSNLADSHFAYGFIADNLWKWPQALAAYRRARQIDPASAPAALREATVLAEIGRFDESLTLLQELERKDPHWRAIPGAIGEVLYAKREYQKAIQKARAYRHLFPDEGLGYMIEGKAALRLGAHAQAKSAWQTLLRLHSSDPLTKLYAEAGILAADQNFNEGRRFLASRQNLGSPWVHAYLSAEFQDAPSTLQHLEKAIDTHDPDAPSVRFEGAFDFLRVNPRFQRLTDRLPK